MDLSIIKKRIMPIALFGILYLSIFFALEQRNVEINIIETKIDRLIPFCEYFIIPYVLWYVLVVGTVLFFMLYGSKEEYESLIISLCAGMVIFVVISFLYPNGQNLRPVLSGDGVFIKMVRLLYAIDTPTNVLPSLHVFNTVACHKAIVRNERCREHKWVLYITGILSVLIIFSTMFLKQHSIIDVVSALFFYAVCYKMVYSTGLSKSAVRRGRRFLKNV